MTIGWVSRTEQIGARGQAVRGRWDDGVKRCADILIAAVALLLASPLLVVVFFLVRLTSRGPGFYRQERVGAGHRTFRMYKFRTMVVDCEQEIHREYVTRMLAGGVAPVNGLYKLASDPRITRVGGFLRRTSLDELPQLLNVLRGDMSLVGPRPALPWEADMFPQWAAARFTVRPGLTGLWQVSGRNHLTMTEGLALDVDYVKRGGFWRDLKILVLTIPAVLKGGAR